MNLSTTLSVPSMSKDSAICHDAAPAAGLRGLLVGMSLGLDAAGASASADGPDFYAVRGIAKGDVLNIRAEPNANAPKVARRLMTSPACATSAAKAG